eukprot:NODE_410_length_7932_cov_0.253160.p3 type:complete len:379 gc:universal NODE_410_length_7932_cov_0.253160:4872-6008(+)
MIGNEKTDFKSCHKGVVQGTCTSPNIFTKLVDMVMQDLGILNVWFCDDLLFVSQRTRFEADKANFKQRLSEIGLKLGEAKTYPLNEQFDKWLGLSINEKGLNRDKHAANNLQNARYKLSESRNKGIFNGVVKTAHLLRYIGTVIMPTLHYGMALHKPDVDIAHKFDVFLNTAVRSLAGIPHHTPIEDIHVYCGYNSYLSRWQHLSSKFMNRVSVKTDAFELIEYVPKSNFSFTMDRQLVKYQEKQPILKAVFGRKYECDVCHQTHRFINHIYQCHSKIIKNDAQMCSKTHNQRVVSLPDSWRIHLQNYQSSMDDNTTHIYSDASFHQHPTTQATAGIIIINKSDYYIKSFKLKKLAIDDSTRSEIAAICCSIKVAEQI